MSSIFYVIMRFFVWGAKEASRLPCREVAAATRWGAAPGEKALSPFQERSYGARTTYLSQMACENRQGHTARGSQECSGPAEKRKSAGPRWFRNPWTRSGLGYQASPVLHFASSATIWRRDCFPRLRGGRLAAILAMTLTSRCRSLRAERGNLQSHDLSSG